MGDWPNDGKLSALNIRRACDASLARLQTDYIDLYQMHHVDRATPWDEIWEAMDVLRQQGKIIYAGSSNFAGWHLVQAQEAANRRGQLGLVSEQSIYNLVERTVELEVLPAAEAYGIGIIPWSPLHGGLLGGVIRKTADGTTSRSASGRAAESLELHRPAIEAWEGFCDERGEGPGDVALAWLLHQPAVTAPIVGPRTVDHLDGALGTLAEEEGLDERMRDGDHLAHRRGVRTDNQRTAGHGFEDDEPEAFCDRRQRDEIALLQVSRERSVGKSAPDFDIHGLEATDEVAIDGCARVDDELGRAFR
jgi:aryl-alcohol dehydrogenase-like predicted oxidoreductase